MSETLIDIVKVSDHPALVRWRAVDPRGAVVGVAGLRPVVAWGHDLALIATPAVRPGAAELSLYVAPGWRRRGIGTRLLAAVRARAAEPRLVADVTAGSPGEAFCRRHGFRHTGSRRHELLGYGDVHGAWLGELVDAAHPGYRLTHWTGDLPDAPRAEELFRSPSGPGNAVLTAADARGDLAAFAVAVVGALAHPRARQYGPVVLPEHRGRRLGLWVNAALIQRLREVHPHVEEVETAIAEDDLRPATAHRQLGFSPVRRRLYELALP